MFTVNPMLALNLSTKISLICSNIKALANAARALNSIIPLVRENTYYSAPAMTSLLSCVM